MVNNIPVNGWPQLKDLEAVQPILNRLDKIEAWKRTVKEETFTGDDITIENALALPARSLITEINAIQPLHGLPFPYVGGAGKNKLPMTASVIKALNIDGTWSGDNYTFLGITYTILTDNAGNVTGIKANGTATGRAYLFICEADYGSSDINFNNATVDGYTYSGTLDHNKRFVYYNSTSHKVYTMIDTGEVCNNVIFYPQREVGSTATSFAPYSNICPISGRTAAVITRSDGDEISEDFTIQLGTTVYGADINWDTGEMTVKTAVVDMGSLTWDKPRDNRFQSTDLNELIYPNADNVIPPDMKCEIYKPFSANQTATMDFGITAFHYATDNITYLRAMDANIHDLTAFMAQIDGKKLEYKLATPTTIQLTPEQLTMLKGYNHITLSDGYGTIELKALTGANWS